MTTYQGGNCFIGKPADGSHGYKYHLCNRCRKVACNNHLVVDEGQRICINCWNAAEETRRAKSLSENR